MKKQVKKIKLSSKLLYRKIAVIEYLSKKEKAKKQKMYNIRKIQKVINNMFLLKEHQL